MKACKVVFSLALTVSLVACGGGTGSAIGGNKTSVSNVGGIQSFVSSGSGSSLASTGSSSTSMSDAIENAEGLWRGTTDTNRTVTSLIVDNGFYWMLYSPAGNSNNIAGVVIGNSLSADGIITSSDGKDFNFETGGLFPLTWRGTYRPKSQLQGTLTYAPAAIVNLNATHDSNYNLTPALAVISGTYRGAATTLARGSQSATFSISTTGQLSGSRADGCTFTGDVTPRPRGNAYSVFIAFNGNNCADRTVTSKGSAYLNPLNRQLYSVTLDSSLNADVFLFVGSK